MVTFEKASQKYSRALWSVAGKDIETMSGVGKENTPLGQISVLFLNPMDITLPPPQWISPSPPPYMLFCMFCFRNITNF